MSDPTGTVLATMDAAGLPPLDGPERTAELLVALAHRCVDWDVWGGPRAVRYWDALTDRVRASCYAGPRLALWWERLTRQMSLSAPGRKEDRQLLASLLTAGDDTAVLDVLRRQAEALVLRVRVAADTKRTTRQQADNTSTDPNPTEATSEQLPY